MKALILGMPLVAAATATAASAQSAPESRMGAVRAAARLQAQGYTELHDLKQQADGSWTAVATRNGMTLNVVEQPDGKITTR